MKLVLAVLLAAGCVWLAACGSNLTQSLLSTTQPRATSISASPGVVSSAQVVSATLPAGAAVPYDILAAGDPMVGTGQNSVAVAWQSGKEAPAALAAFPEEAQTVLGQLTAQGGSDLYLAIYGGLQPSNGYEVKVISMDKRDGWLQVTYQIAGPPPGQGGATVMTHPYVIARLNDTTLQPADVTFVEQKPAR
jgi:hypothetical protein